MLTAETLTPFVGGDIEVQVIPRDEMAISTDVLRGPIQKVEDAGINVLVFLEWAARCNMRTEPGEWKKADNTQPVVMPVYLKTVRPDVFGRINLVTDEKMFTIYPPDGPKLDPAKVE